MNIINYQLSGLLIGPRGATQKQMQEMSGAKIVIRGRGSQKDGAPPTGHPDDEVGAACFLLFPAKRGKEYYAI